MHRPTSAAFVFLGALAVACYQDDTFRPDLTASTKVLLTDDPFPFDSVASVNLHVSRIEASPQLDTTGLGTWIEVAAPKKSFDLLPLQHGATALVGEGTIDAGSYVAIRMTIDVDRSSIKYLDGSDAVVLWPYPGHGEIALYAIVAQPLAVAAATGAEIVIDFDVGRSFLYRPLGSKEFVLLPALRAVNSATTGTLIGTVTSPDIEGQGSVPVHHANITVYGGTQSPMTGFVAATGRTDAQGRYAVAFLSAGSYTIRAEQPDLPWLAAVTTPGVMVRVGDTTRLPMALPRVGAGGTFLHVTGPTTVYVGGRIVLRAAVGDSVGDPISNPSISWLSRDPLTAIPVDSSYADTLQFVLGLREGTTWIVATSGALADSLPLEVVSPPSSNPVASVTVSPATLHLAVGDSTFLQATLRDADGIELADRPISWFPADSSGVVELLVTLGPTAVLKARRSGTTVIRAVSEGKSGSATVTVQ